MRPAHLFLALAMLLSLSVYGQQQYTIEGQTLNLKTQVEGQLTLLWNVIDGEYRYFSKKGNTIVPLVNTKIDKDYQEEYKTVLADQTADGAVSVNNVKLTLSSLTNFFNTYNSQMDSTFVAEAVGSEMETRLGGFFGVNNNIYFVNPDNTALIMAGIDFEILEKNKLRRHSLVFQLRQLFSNSNYDFSSTQVSMNYRFKYVQTESLDLFINLKIAEYTYIDRTLDAADVNDDLSTIAGSGGSFRSPLAFGLGADIPAGNGLITVAYSDIVAIAIDNNGEFPIDFSLGYKFRL
ncbi:hypothetical protein [Aureitalea marina]|uniref:Outer membrane protein beta-barrel domain-containing protein n=1 Tax=Aureitalea marina TaxID=930804 RepID=A0A2S7KLF9_9FLAO|nr:hypothetical protein [Aureitalea marina]PQB03465.1 hypothetical protein BST85_00075 [Aureitalea marina]